MSTVKTGITLAAEGEKEFRKAITGINTDMKVLNSELKKVTSEYGKNDNSVKGLTEKSKILNSQVEKQKDKIEELKKALKNAEETYGETDKKTQQWKISLNNAEASLNNLQSELDDTNKKLKNMPLEETSKKLESFGNKASKFGSAMTKGVTAPIAGISVAAGAAWKTVDEAYDGIAAGTGAVGDKLDNLTNSFNNVFGNFPASAEDVSTCIADINTRFGFTDEQLENCSKSFLQFAEVNNTDVSTAIKDVSRYMGDASIPAEEYTDVLDALTSASQASGIQVAKLAEDCTKYGAPMRALGYDTKESIAVFATWEKAGVNTEIAFSGMKKAISNWGKEGKDAREEFKKTLKAIADAPDIAKATSMAIEAFGAKAGPDLADAIQGGRFSIEEMMETVVNAEGQLNDSFEAMQDAPDKAKVALNQLTLAGADLASTALETLGPTLLDIVDDVKELCEWFGGLDDSTKKNIIKFGMFAAAIGPVSSAIGKVSTAASKAYKFLEKMPSKMGILTGAIGGVSLAITGVITVASLLQVAEDKRLESIRKLTAEEQKNADAIDEIYSSYSSAMDSRDKNSKAIFAEYGNLKLLNEELHTLVDENGKVKEGYEGRVNVITGILSNALGTEIKVTDGVIENYKELKSSIDGVIRSKQAQALLNANETLYTQALEKQTDALNELVDAEENLKKGKEDLSQAQQKLNDLQEKYDNSTLPQAQKEERYRASIEKTKRDIEAYSQKVDELSGNYDKASEAYSGYAAQIKNYENLTGAIVSENADEINEAIKKMTNNFITAETGTKQSLERQVENMKKNYESLKTAMENGSASVTLGMIEESKEMVDKSIAELDKFESKANDSTTKAGNSAIQGWKNTSPYMQSAAYDMMQNSKNGMDTVDFYSSGKGAVLEISSGINAYSPDVRSAVDDIVNDTDYRFGALSSNASTYGVDFVSGLASGIRSAVWNVKGAVETVASAIKSRLHFSVPDEGPLTDYETWMPDFMEGLSQGIEKNKYKVTDSIKGLTSGIKSNIDLKPQEQSLNVENTIDRKIERAVSRLNTTATVEAPFIIGTQEFGRAVIKVQTKYNKTVGGAV